MLLFILVMIANTLGILEGSNHSPCVLDTSLPLLSPEIDCVWSSVNREEAPCLNANYSCQSNPTAVNLSLLTTANGLVDVNFLMPDVNCGHTDYLVELRVNEHLTPEQCSMASIEQLNVTHTRRKYKIVNNCTDYNPCLPCNKTGVVSFQHIFDGCYMLKIQPHINERARPSLWSCPQYLRTSYKKQSLADIKPKVSIQYRSALLNLLANITYPPLCSKLRFIITLLENSSQMEKACFMSDEAHSDYSMESNNTLDCDSRICQNKGEHISCKFDNVTAGNYCVSFEIEDDRCVPQTVWSQHNKECKWQSCQEAAAGLTNISEIVIPGGINSYMIAGTLVIIALLLASIGTWSICRLAVPIQPMGDVSSTADSIVPPATNILLLYSRDCPQFMELMNTLRRLIQNITSTKVYDCFDPRHWDEMSCDSLGWIRQLTRRQDVKVVLVASRCASWRHKALCSRQILRYREPSSIDPLFLAAVKELQETPPNDVYSRVFVVRFQDLSDDTDLFANLNSYARFVLPAHLSALLIQLTRASFTDLCSDLKDSKEWKELQQNLADLIAYTNQNTNYLKDMLTIHDSNPNSSFNIIE